MSAFESITLATRLAQFAMAGVGTAVVLMAVALVLLLLRERATRTASKAHAGVLAVANLLLVALGSILFWLVVMYTFAPNSVATVAERWASALAFVASASALCLLYIRATPEFIASIREKVSRVKGVF
jgi:hypothetical protein